MAGGAKDDAGGTTVTSVKSKAKTGEDVVDYKAEMQEFRETINDLYYEKAVKLMEEVEEKRREDEMAMITL